MRKSLPRLDYRATSRLQPGSVIEYEVEKPFRQSKSFSASAYVREIALIVHIEWAPSNGRSRVHILTEAGDFRVVDMCYVCQIHII